MAFIFTIVGRRACSVEKQEDIPASKEYRRTIRVGDVDEGISWKQKRKIKNSSVNTRPRANVLNDVFEDPVRYFLSTDYKKRDVIETERVTCFARIEGINSGV